MRLAARAVNEFAKGYRYAMLAGAALALIGALVSLTRGAHAAGPAAPHAGGPARPPAAPAGD